MEFFSSEDYQKYMYQVELREELKHSVQAGFQGVEVFYQPQVILGRYKIHGGIIALYIKAIWKCSAKYFYSDFRENRFDDSCGKLGNAEGFFTVRQVEKIPSEISYEFECIVFTAAGTGYSSLSYLKGLEIDAIKIDRCFVNQIQNSAYNYKLLHNMIELAHSAQISVCCEGIEFEEELEFSDQVIRLMECSGKSQEIQQTVNIVLQHVARFYEADRTYLYLYQGEMDVWQNVGEYQAPGIIPRAQCHQTVESGFLLPWIEILKKNKDTVILKRDALGEDKNELIEAMQIQGVEDILLCSLWKDQQLIGCTGWTVTGGIL